MISDKSIARRMPPVPLPPPPLFEHEVAEWLRVSIDTVRRERRKGRIKYKMIGGRPRYRHEWVADYIDSNGVSPCLEGEPESVSKSAHTGSREGRTAPLGAEHGTMRPPDKRAAHRSALTILGGPRSRSRSG